MAKVLKVVAVVAAVVALAATGVGLAVPGLMVAGMAIGTIAAIASAVSTLASMGARALAKKPKAQGAVSQVVIGANLPVPYGMGRTYAGGMQVFDNSGGGSTNPWRYQVNVLSAAGPIDSFEKLMADYAPVTVGASSSVSGWYAGFLTVQYRVGNRPESAFTGLSAGWGANHKMSGYAAYAVSMKFDKDAKRFASGVPQFGAVFKGVKVYDPRKDSTYPGGSGSHRWNDEATWEWSDNPGLHALAYGRGRFIEKDAGGVPLSRPVKVIGIGFAKSAIIIEQFVEFANLCEANNWKIGGTIYEQPGTSKWNNLKSICRAGGGEPVFSGGRLGVRFFAPRPSLFTITADDLAGPPKVVSGRSWRDKLNNIIPRYREEAHNWEYVQAPAVTSSTYITEDGSVKSREIQWDLVQNPTQVRQLAAYDLTDMRELGPITLPVKPRLMPFRVGECGVIAIPDIGLPNQKVVITGRHVDPSNGMVTLTFDTETNAKHAFALGLTGVAPASPSLRTSEEIDTGVAEGGLGVSDVSLLIQNSYAQNMTFTVAANGEVVMSAHQRVYSDKTVNVNGGTFTVAGATAGDLILIYYDDQARAGGAVTYQYLRVPGGIGDTESAANSPANPYRHLVAVRGIPSTGTLSGGTAAGSGGGGVGWTGTGRVFQEEQIQ